MTCSFASESSSQGCVILLQLSSSTELLYVARSGRNGSQCNQTENQADAYVNITASDWEANGNVGSGAYLLQPTLVDDEGVYFTLTGCMLPQPPDPITVSTLSGGAIAGIVIAAVVVGAAVLVVAVLLLVYRVRTGHWFKLREKDDDKFTVHFEKELLMGEAKPKKRYKVRCAIILCVRFLNLSVLLIRLLLPFALVGLLLTTVQRRRKHIRKMERQPLCH